MSEMLQTLRKELDIREQHMSLVSSGNNPSFGDCSKDAHNMQILNTMLST